nr:MAG TPA: hypothetical protein [Caudoviricetes sp.]
MIANATIEDINYRFYDLLENIKYRNERYPYGNVDNQLVTIYKNLDALRNDPDKLFAYKKNLIPRLERLSYQLKRLVA